MKIRLGVIGWPLTKTFSPKIHKSLSQISNIDIDYKKLPIETFTLDTFESLNNDFDGYNITIPHKENIYNLSKDLNNASFTLCLLTDNVIHPVFSVPVAHPSANHIPKNVKKSSIL